MIKYLPVLWAENQKRPLHKAFLRFQDTFSTNLSTDFVDKLKNAFAQPGFRPLPNNLL